MDFKTLCPRAIAVLLQQRGICVLEIRATSGDEKPSRVSLHAIPVWTPISPLYANERLLHGLQTNPFLIEP